MPRTETENFVVELPLVTTSRDIAILESRLKAGQNLYNACLSECLKRMQLVRESEAYQAARQISRDKKKERSEAFLKARKAYRYSDYDIQAYATIVATSSKWIKQHLDSNTIQKVATRAFKATERVLFGKADRVRFKQKGQFSSLEGKSNKQGIRWKNNQVIWKSELHNLTLKAIIDNRDEVIQYALSCPIKYVRILRRWINGKARFFAQLVCKGLPYQKPKNQLGKGVVGIDVNVSVIGAVGDDSALIEGFCTEIEQLQKGIKQLQRKIERSRRANNPQNYEPNFFHKTGRKKKGKIKKGRKLWNNTNTYKKDSAKLREIHRKQAEQRETSQGRLINKVLKMGDSFKMENVSIKAWQKIWGKSIGYKAPGFFMSELERKAESAGASVHKFSTRTTALSQMCICGIKQKKSLSQRVHKCECGVELHRDLFSGFLARYVDSESKLSLELASDGWLCLEQIMQAEWKSESILINKRDGHSVSALSVVEGPELIAAESNSYQEVEIGEDMRNLVGDFRTPRL